MNHLDTQPRDNPDDHSDLVLPGPPPPPRLDFERAQIDKRFRELERLMKKEREEEEELKKEAIEDWKILREEEENKTKAKQKEDEECKERMRKTLLNNGYSGEEIERIFKHGEKGKEKNHDYYHPGPPAHPAGAISMARPTFLKVNKKHIDPETLDAYEIEWEHDDVCVPCFHYISS